MVDILLVEDDVRVRRSIVRCLDSQGHRILEASNGDEALQILEREVIELVITDVHMPEKDGLELIMELSKKSPDLKLIAISGGVIRKNSKASYLESAQFFGAHELLEKPFSDEMLLKAVTHVLSGSKLE